MKNNFVIFLAIVLMCSIAGYATEQLKVFSLDEGLPESNISKPRIYIENTGNDPLHDFTIYYYITTENGNDIIVEDYYTPASTVTLENTGENEYRIKYDFTGYTLMPGHVCPDWAGNVVGLHYNDWSTWDSGNDYSNNNSSSFLENPNITLYDSNGVLIYGTPPDTAGTISLEGEFKDQAIGVDNQVDVRIRLTNTGNLELDGFHVYYYFTIEAGHTPELSDLYTPFSEPQLEHLGGPEYRIHYDYQSSTLMPGAVFPHTDGSSVRINYTDWSFFDKSNDYSYNNNQGYWIVNPHIVVTDANGYLLFGSTPPPPFMDFDTVAGGEEEAAAMELNDRDELGMDLGITIPGARQYIKQEGDDIYQEVRLVPFGQLVEIGKPALPSRIKYVLLPEDADINVTSTTSTSRVLSNYNIYPAQEEPIPLGDETQYPPFAKDEAFYAANTIYPEHIVEIESIIKIRDKRLAAIRINPVQFNPALGELTVHSGINFSLDFTGGTGFEPSEYPGINGIVDNLVLNPLAANTPTAAGIISPDRGKILVITPYRYKEAVDPFALWKRQMGFEVIVKTRNYWERSLVFDTIAEVLPDYLILVGDIDDIPSSFQSELGFTPDIYYAFLDDEDRMIDMAFSRISVSSLEEAHTVLQKIINYEKYPPENPSFYTDVLGVSFFEDDHTTGEPGVKSDGIADIGFAETVWYTSRYLEETQGYNTDLVLSKTGTSTPGFWRWDFYDTGREIPDYLRQPNFAWDGDAGDIKNKIDAGKFLVYHSDHGATNRWANPYFDINNALSLNNGNLLPVVFSMNCESGMFNVDDCLTEAWMSNPNGGAVAVISACKLTGTVTANAFLYGAIDAMWPDPGIIPGFEPVDVYPSPPVAPIHTPLVKLSDIYLQAWLRMTEITGWNPGSYDSSYLPDLHFNLYISGDPSMEIWKYNPGIITADFPGYITDETPFIISGATCDTGTATLVSGGRLIGQGNIVDGSATIELIAPPATDTVILTITSSGYRPLIEEIDNYNAAVCISPEETVEVYSLQVSEGQIGWKGYLANGNAGYYLYEDGQTRYIHDPTGGDTHYYFLNRGYLSWNSPAGIHYYDTSQTTPLLFPMDTSYIRYIHGDGDQIVWSDRVGDDYELLTYHDNEISFITDNTDFDSSYDLRIDNGLIAWQRVFAPPRASNIILFDGTSETELFLYGEDRYVEMDDGVLVWEHWDGNDWEIATYDYNNPGAGILILTNNDLDDYRPHIDKGQVVWWTMDADGHSTGITLHEAGVPDRFFAIPIGIWELDIDNGIIIWEGYSTPEDSEIFCIRDGLIHQLTNNNIPDRVPVLDNGVLCWVRKQETTYYDRVMMMYLDEPAISEPVPTDLPPSREPIIPDPPGFFRQIYEAEDAEWDEATTKIRNLIPGYSGTGYVFINWASDRNIEFTFSMEEFKMARIVIYYSNASGTGRTTEITIDGGILTDNFQFATHDSWDIWAETSLYYPLGPGEHTLRLTSKSPDGLPLLDCIAVAYPVEPDEPGLIWFDPDQVSPAPGTTFQTGIHINTGGQGLYSYDMILHYNPALLEPVLPLVAGPNSPSPEINILFPGKINLYDYNLSTPSGDDLHLLDIQWQVLQPGTTEVVLTVNEVKDIFTNTIGYPRGSTLEVSIP